MRCKISAWERSFVGGNMESENWVKSSMIWMYVMILLEADDLLILSLLILLTVGLILGIDTIRI